MLQRLRLKIDTDDRRHLVVVIRAEVERDAASAAYASREIVDEPAGDRVVERWPCIPASAS